MKETHRCVIKKNANHDSYMYQGVDPDDAMKENDLVVFIYKRTYRNNAF